MNVQAEVSLYPLRKPTLMESIDGFVEHLDRANLNVEIGPMSSRIRGQCSELFRALGEAFEEIARDTDAVLIVKLSNACPSGQWEDG